MKVHFIAVIGDTHDTAACGLWNPENVTGELAAVTCQVCRRSRSFYMSKLRPEDRTPALVEYRKFAEAQ